MLNESDSRKLIISLSDMSQSWTVDALNRVICNELSRSDKPLDSDLIDIACVRLMLLNGIDITPKSLREFEEALMNGILCNVLGMSANNY